jgi:hypothetical protein
MRKSLAIIILFGVSLFAQRSDPTLLTIGYHTGNRAGISFYNDGQIAGFNAGVDIRGEWPLGSGENYIGDCIPLIGVEFINDFNDTLQSVAISRGPRRGQADERSPIDGHFWGWNPVPGFRNPNYPSVAMSHIPQSWPIEGWNDPVANSWRDEDGNTQWFGFFGRGIFNADQESFFEADDQFDDEFNANFNPDSTDITRDGMALRMRQRGFQWSSFLAEDAIFWLYEINNDGTTIYRKADFGTVVGTLAGGDGDSQDDLGFFDIEDWITYSWDSDGIGNVGQKVGYIGYAFLESPGNPFDGIDNDNDSKETSSPLFVASDFDSVVYNTGDQVVLINEAIDGNGLRIYERTLHQVGSTTDTVFSLGVRFIIEPGVTYFKEGNAEIRVISGQEVFIPDPTANDAIDNDLDGLVDENQATHYETRIRKGLDGLAYKNYITGEGLNDLLIDERRDNDIDEDGDWDPEFDDVGEDGLGPNDRGYPGPDVGEGDGIPTQGEPNYGITDPDESDQIGLTGFNFFELNSAPDLSIDSTLWNRMTPGRFDVVPPTPQDGDFIYSSGFFPLFPATPERFSVSLLWGEDFDDIVNNKRIVQDIYNAGYKFPQAPLKPKINLTQNDGKVVIYWDGEETENSRDFVSKQFDFEGYKIYRSTDANFRDARTITNALGVLTFDKPIAQYDLENEFSGFFIPSPELLETFGGTTFFFGENDGVINRYVDSTVIPGIKYYYAVSAFDHGDGTPDIFPEENSKFIFRTNTGQVILDDNTGFITPGRRPAGYSNAFLNTLEKSENFFGTGDVAVEIIDESDIRDGFEYQIVFEDTGLTDVTANWSLLDLQTPDTVYVPLSDETFIVNPNDSIPLPEGTDTIYVNGSPVAATGPYYTANYHVLVDMSTTFFGETPIRHGVRSQLYNDPIMVDTAFFTDIESDPEPEFEVTRFVALFPERNGIKTPNDYLIELFDSIVDTSLADTIGPQPRHRIPASPVNFKVKNLTADKYIDFSYNVTGALTPTYSIWFRENIKGEHWRTWRINIRYSTFGAPLEQTGTFSLKTLKPFNEQDSFHFTVEGAKIDNSLAKAELDKIKVVPNPYIVTHAGEERLLSFQTSGRGEREIRFTYVPPGSKISIFTVRGELVKTLYSESLYVGDVYWNLRSEDNIDVAYGIYVYVVEAPNIGNKIGKLALIK